MGKAEVASTILSEIQHELQSLSLWQDQPPSKEALASTAPFCCDTLDFHQWLQFIMIPRFHQMITANTPLPENIAVTPMAEEFYSGSSIHVSKLLSLLQSFDDLLSGNKED